MWKFLDNGTDQGTAWRQHGFDDATWRSGPAELGYGDGDEATVVSYGSSTANRHITTYFRHTFDVPNPSTFAALILRLIRDDGAVVYINGTEVWRSNITSSTLTYTTPAYNVGTSTEERTWVTKTIPPSVLRAGANTVAVEVHQSDAASSDVSFNFELAADTSSPTPTMLRGPYLQLGTPTSITVRWRTDYPSDSRVYYGLRPGSLTSQTDNATPTTEHSVTLTGLTPATRYYYAVGTTAKILTGDDASHTFLTSPTVDTPLATRVWVLGDAGTGGTGALAVRNAYYNYAGGTTSTNLWLLLGDNAYSSGTDVDYESGIFKMYPEMLRSSVVWPSIGNHDTAESFTHSLAYPYYSIFDVPTRGEAGGIPSGTESYYSFDYGNIHFIALDSQTSDRTPDGPMMTWLKNDLAANLQHWTIAFWHHPPYSHGSHNSDTSLQLIDVRQNILPVLEAGGVDLVLCGHSHAYERSFLVDGHHGTSNTLNQNMIKDGSNGATTPYHKANVGPHEGAVFVVSGAAGVIVERDALDHPVMVSGLYNFGSTILDISGDRIDVKFLRETGAIADSFSIVKDAALRAPAAPSSLQATPQSATSVALSWIDNGTNEDGNRVSRCSGATCTDFVEIAQLGANSTTYLDTGVSGSTVYLYRVAAYNVAGASAFSNIAEATTPAGLTPPMAPSSLTATSQSSTSITLTWTDNAANEDGTRISRCSGASCTDFAEIAQLAANVTSFADHGLTGNTLYRYRVAAYNTAGASAFSNVAEATTPAAVTTPAAPSNLTASAASTTQVHLAWTDNATNETGYRVERCSGASCTSFAEIAQLGAGVVSYADNAASASTLYRYRVAAFNTAGASAFSNVAEATTPATVTTPAAPSNLTASAVSATRMNLAWIDNATNETGYRVERCSGASCTNFVEIAQLGAGVASYADNAASANTLYRYRVAAYNAAGASAFSNTAQATTPAAATPPAAPSNLTATAASTTRIDLAWTDNATNESGYRVQRCSGASCTSFVEIAQLGAGVASYADNTASANTLYRYRVAAYNATGASAFSNTAQATTPAPPTPPAAPSNLTATAASATRVNLAWNDNASNETGYRIERCSGSTSCTAFREIGVVGTNVRAYTDSTTSKNTHYRYRVRAYNAAGTSGFSNIATERTPSR
ncbi:MAG TPA: metallophosphoesterase [Thermoanaerobaculia bacterium]|nr:metallophosphoesterase [Thermoanaerobaculia bacterium]